MNTRILRQWSKNLYTGKILKHSKLPNKYEDNRYAHRHVSKRSENALSRLSSTTTDQRSHSIFKHRALCNFRLYREIGGTSVKPNLKH